MKHLFAFLTVLLILSGIASARQNTIKVLAIGNSFSEDAVEQNLHELGLNEDIDIIVGNMYIGGCSLERHYANTLGNKAVYAYRKIGGDGVKTEKKNVALSEALMDEQWDVVTLQQCSDFSGISETYEPYLGRLITYVKKYVPKKTRLMFHQTWAYEKGSTHRSFYRYGFDQEAMYDAIVRTTSAVCKKYGIQVIPCGTAIQNARKTLIGDNITRDGYHLNKTVGRYVAACTWYEALTGNNPVGNGYIPCSSPDGDGCTSYSMSREFAEIAQRSAHEAVLHPFDVTVTVEKEKHLMICY